MVEEGRGRNSPDPFFSFFEFSRVVAVEVLV